MRIIIKSKFDNVLVLERIARHFTVFTNSVGNTLAIPDACPGNSHIDLCDS